MEAVAKVSTDRVPRHLIALNQYVERFGIKTATKIEADDDGDRAVIVEWRGTLAALRRSCLVPRSWQAPVCRGTLPDRFGIGCAEIHVGRRNRFEIRGASSIPLAIEDQGAVEISRWTDETTFFGGRDALIAAGVCANRHFPMKKGLKSGSDNGFRNSSTLPEWRTVRWPTGEYMHSVETRRAIVERLQRELSFEEAWSRTSPRTPVLRRALHEASEQLLTNDRKAFDQFMNLVTGKGGDS
jgi:hypothetical protein